MKGNGVMSKTKKILGFLLAGLMLFSAMPLGAFASAETTAQPALYAFYGDGMLFQQKQEAILAGTGSAGTVIECRLTDENGVTAAKAASECTPDGNFEVGFTAPEGGFSEYTISVLANGKEFARLNNVVFGELWLASGQSNMQFCLNCTPSWENIEKNGYGSKWIRFLHGPDFPAIKGQDDGYIPNQGQDDYLGCRWVSASEPKVGEISGVGYFFAEELFEKINMPVGVLAVYLGGSPIRSWISRQTLESSPEAMKVLKSHKQYVSSSKWDPQKQNYSDLASNYNAKIYPLRHFRPAGVVWYQGETELLCNYTYGEYSTMFDLLQKDFTRTFSHANGSIPMVYTQLACYNYRADKRDMQSLNAEFAEICSKSPETRAVTTIYDVPLDFKLEWGSIHPSVKEPVGRRLGCSAAGLVYGKCNTFSAAYPKDVRIDGSDVFITLGNVGDGLVSTSKVLYDFAICSNDGIYYPAEAEIVSADTIRVRNSNISKPKSVTYAFSQVNSRASLWSTENGEKVMPVSPFVTDRSISKVYYADTPWADCEQEKQYRTGSRDQFVGFFDLWETNGCSYEIQPESAFKGTGGLSISAENRKFSIKETFVFDIDDESISQGKPIKFNESSRKWNKYGALKFAVKNKGNKDISFAGAKIKILNGIWVSPEVNGSGDIKCTVPADGEWHIIELDLNKLYLKGNTLSLAMTNIIFDEVHEFEVCFEGDENENAAIDVDAFEFTPKAEHHSLLLSDIFMRIRDFVSYIYEQVLNAFRKIITPIEC